MAPTIAHLPNGHSITVTPVFGGLFFKSNNLTVHSSVFPAGWTIILHSEDYSDEHEETKESGSLEDTSQRRQHIHRYKQPTLHNDSLFISSISNPSNNDFKPPASPTRQIAMMLWITLYWYFHQPEPPLHITTEASKDTPDEAKPKGDWRINIKREGIFRGRYLLHKLERMGLIASEDSSVGSSTDEKTVEGWVDMFVSRRSFWQLSAKLFLFTLSPASYPGSPNTSRPSSPVRGSEPQRTRSPNNVDKPGNSNRGLPSPGLWSPQTPGPFASGSHLPTYFPPPPPQYIITKDIRHPIRPKPPRQGETFYMRYIPSVEQYLSFRVANLHNEAVAYKGPVASLAHTNLVLSPIPAHITSSTISSEVGIGDGPINASEAEYDISNMSDLQLLHKWMNKPRVSKFWGVGGPISVQETFLKAGLESRHSFPVIGCWDGKPFGYFEIYWVKEDILGRHLSTGDVGDWDIGFHALVGEEEYRGEHRVRCWISSIIHWALIADYRTNHIVVEPRVDNERYVSIFIILCIKIYCNVLDI
jgi:N5-hydroxyornithine acetyltransferase